PPPSTLFPYTTLFRSCAHRFAVTGHEHVFGPQIAVQKSVGATRVLHQLDASRCILDERVDTLQQARPGASELRWQARPDRLQRLDRKSTRLNSSHDQS